MVSIPKYSTIIEGIFRKKYKTGATEIDFDRDEFVKIARKAKIAAPKNLGDVIYSFRYRRDLPKTIRETAKKGKMWVIRPKGRSKYCFVQIDEVDLNPKAGFAFTKVPDSTPGIVSKYSFNDEQALLTKIRYNRLIDIFTGVTCYSLQNHLRTTVEGMGQVETDEVYVGIDKKGAHYVFTVQAKGGTDKIGVVQIEQDFALCKEKFPSLICRPVAAQFLSNDTIVLFEFVMPDENINICCEKHYKLVPPDEITEADLVSYRESLSD